MQNRGHESSCPMTYAVNEYKPKRRQEKVAKLIAQGMKPDRAEKAVPRKWESIIRLQLPDGKAIVDRKRTPATSESGAKAWAKQREIELIRKAGAPAPKKHVPTLREWWPKYMRACIGEDLAGSTITNKQSNYNAWLEPQLGNLPLDQITDEKRSALQQAMKLAGRGRSSTSNVLQSLSACLNKAIEHKVLAAMPCSFGKIAKLKTATPSRTPFYMNSQIEALLASAPDLETEAIILLGCDAGMRAGEIAGLEWPSVSFDRGEIVVERSIWYGVPPDKAQAWIEAGKPRDARPKREYISKLPKHDKIRRVPLTKRLASVLRKLRLRSQGKQVLLKADGKWHHRVTLSKLLAIAEERAGLPRDREGCVHVLRHTFCSRLALAGTPPHVIMALAGHHALSVTSRYLHLAPRAEASAVALLESASELETRAETANSDSATG